MYSSYDLTMDPYFYTNMLNIPDKYYFYLKDEDMSFEHVYHNLYSELYPLAASVCSRLTDNDFPINRSAFEALLDNVLQSINNSEQCNEAHINTYQNEYEYKYNLDNLKKDMATVILVKQVLNKYQIL